jgi:hypothetical protein
VPADTRRGIAPQVFRGSHSAMAPTRVAKFFPPFLQGGKGGGISCCAFNLRYSYQLTPGQHYTVKGSLTAMPSLYNKQIKSVTAYLYLTGSGICCRRARQTQAGGGQGHRKLAEGKISDIKAGFLGGWHRSGCENGFDRLAKGQRLSARRGKQISPFSLQSLQLAHYPPNPPPLQCGR